MLQNNKMLIWKKIVIYGYIAQQKSISTKPQDYHSVLSIWIVYF